MRIAAAVAGAAAGVTRRVMTEANGNVGGAEVDEVLLQSYLFAGFPRTLNATAIWREISGSAPPAEDLLASADHIEQWEAAGDLACRRVYGPVYQTLRDNVRALHPALDSMDGSGWIRQSVVASPALRSDIARAVHRRSVCTPPRQEPQLRSHLRGALNCGATRDELVQTLAALTDVIPLEAMTAAREQLTRLKEL